MKQEYDFSEAQCGPVVKPLPGKTRIMIRLDDEVLAWFREQAHTAGGANYQTLINDILAQHMTMARKKLEKAD